VSLSANHLQKLRLSFQLTTPLGHTFKPHQVATHLDISDTMMATFFLTSFSKCVQVFLKLRHESKVEHLFVVPGSARQFKIVLVSISTLELASLVLWMLIIHCGNVANTLDQALNYLEKLHLYTNKVFEPGR
jgi:hypothetical protein